MDLVNPRARGRSAAYADLPRVSTASTETFSPPAGVLRALRTPGSMVFFKKLTEPSTNRKLAPPGERLPKPCGDRLIPSVEIAPVGRVAPWFEIAHDFARHDRIRRAVAHASKSPRNVAAEHRGIARRNGSARTRRRLSPDRFLVEDIRARSSDRAPRCERRSTELGSRSGCEAPCASMNGKIIACQPCSGRPCGSKVPAGGNESCSVEVAVQSPPDLFEVIGRLRPPCRFAGAGANDQLLRRSTAATRPGA